MPAATPVEAIAIGRRAADWLREARQAEVLHLSEGACHLTDGRAGLLSLVTNEQGMGPYGLQLPREVGPLRRHLDPSHRATVTTTGLQLGPITVLTGGVWVSSFRPDWAGLRRDPRRLRDAIDVLRTELDKRPGVDEGRLRRARELATSLAGGYEPAALVAANRLAGVGEGLTPAGDDLIIGVLHALWVTSPRPSRREEVAERAAERTTTLSAAWLRAAAAGEAVQAWCELVRALAGGDPQPAISGVLAMGHSTGLHTLTGFVVGIEAMTRCQEER
jgi:hypothetical protein